MQDKRRVQSYEPKQHLSEAIITTCHGGRVENVKNSASIREANNSMTFSLMLISQLFPYHRGKTKEIKNMMNEKLIMNQV